MVDKADRPDGFLSRWARRKNDALQGKPLDEPLPARAGPPVVAGAAVPGSAAPLAARTPGTSESSADQARASDPAAEPAKALSLDDVRDLTHDSDFKPFMSRGVEPGVRNAAMKKLFADPHFNVMDRLDIYIDDYSLPDPLPAAMLRQMASAKFLKLFDEEEEGDADGDKGKESRHAPAAASAPDACVARESAHTLSDDSLAQSGPVALEPADPTALRATQTPDSQPEAPTPSGARQENHAHIDLRLQPDHAAEDPEPGRGAA
jgi:hypothetical protein